MVTSPTFDAEKLRASSQQLRDAAAIYAGKVAVRAADLAGQGVHLRRVDQRLGHHLPVGGDVVLLIALFFLGGGRCLSLRGLRLGWGRSAEIQAHKSYTPSK